MRCWSLSSSSPSSSRSTTTSSRHHCHQRRQQRSHHSMNAPVGNSSSSRSRSWSWTFLFLAVILLTGTDLQGRGGGGGGRATASSSTSSSNTGILLVVAAAGATTRRRRPATTTTRSFIRTRTQELDADYDDDNSSSSATPRSSMSGISSSMSGSNRILTADTNYLLLQDNNEGQQLQLLRRMQQQEQQQEEGEVAAGEDDDDDISNSTTTTTSSFIYLIDGNSNYNITDDDNATTTSTSMQVDDGTNTTTTTTTVQDDITSGGGGPVQFGTIGGGTSTSTTSSSCSITNTNDNNIKQQQLLRKFNPSIHKSTYTVGVLAIRGFDAAYLEFNTTFNQYLSLTAGRRYDIPINFVMKPLNFTSLFSDSETSNVDFIYVNPSAYSCIESEYEAYSLASQVSRRNVHDVQYNLKKFGGVIVTRADNHKINTIQDLKNKVIAAASISGLGSGQMQFREMINNDMDYLNDPKQLIFTSNQGKVVQGVLEGKFDVGFIRTDQLERSKDSTTGLPIDLTQFKIINPKKNLTIDGEAFPFTSSTRLYPEWNIAALTHVPDDISREVQRAMLGISDHAGIGINYSKCITTHNETYCDTRYTFPSDFVGVGRNYDTVDDEDDDDGSGSGSSSSPQAIDDDATPCDTSLSKEIATLAVTAMKDGKYSSWTPTLSYMQLRSMQEDTGFIRLEEDANGSSTWRCVRSSELYDAVTCPKHQRIKPKDEFLKSCSEQGFSCPEGMQCVCQPCYTPHECIDSISMGHNRCVSYSVFLPALLVPIALLSFGSCLYIVQYKSRQLVVQAEIAAQNERELNEFIAHEVRNPLTAAISASTFLNGTLHGKDPITDPLVHQSLRDDAAIIDSSVRFINDLLRSMLDLHKAKNEKMSFEYQAVDMKEDIFEPVRSMIYTRDTKFHVNIDCPPSFLVHTDKIRIQQVVLNLARNAAKFVDEGFINLRCVVVDGSVQIYVEDSGPGIPESKRKELFSRFQQSLDRMAQGTGVGLNLCKHLIEAMGGEIYLDESYRSGYKDKLGARIVVNLKRGRDHVKECMITNPAEEDDESTSIEITKEKVNHALPEKCRILFVDDDRILRKQFIRAITRTMPAWETREAASGETALQIVEEEDFDVIFMDQYMTSVEQCMKGTDTIRALRAKGVTSIACGLSANNLKDAFLSAGADTFHLKPFPCREDELRVALQAVLRCRQERADTSSTVGTEVIDESGVSQST